MPIPDISGSRVFGFFEEREIAHQKFLKHVCEILIKIENCEHDFDHAQDQLGVQTV